MGKYIKPLAFTLLAIGALMLQFWNDDFALVSPLAFIILLILALRSALKATDTSSSRFKLLVVLTVILGLITVYGLMTANPPQCPDSWPANYTQQQIEDAHNHCIVGANIGGIYVFLLFIDLPFAIVLTCLWTPWLRSYYKKKHP